MDVSDKQDSDSQNLLQTLVSLTGLPAPLVYEELDQILAVSNTEQKKPADLTLDELRQAMLVYLETLQQEHALLTEQPAGELE